MSNGNSPDFSERLEITELRVNVMTRVITLALATNAVPLGISSLYGLPRPESENPFCTWGLARILSLPAQFFPGIETCFWHLVVSGWMFLALAIACGAFFVAAAPRWVRKMGHQYALDLSYPTACIFLALGAVTMAAAAINSVTHFIATPDALLRP